jgi:hypothetical protein
MNINDLSDKLIFEIFTHLDADAFLVSSAVCHKWNKIIQDNIDFFTSWFAGSDDEEEEENLPKPEEEKKLVGPNGEIYTEEQQMFVDQILAFKSSQFYDMLGVSENADEDEIRVQYKKVRVTLKRYPTRSRSLDSSVL